MNKESAVKISIVTAITIAVADMVGIGVFTSLGFQVLDFNSGFTIIALWTVGGIVALCGALCYAELATMFPRSGGEYNFLTRTYHPAVGFMSGWLSATVGFAAPMAAIAMAFGFYLEGALPEIEEFSNYIKNATEGTIAKAGQIGPALILVWLITLLQLFGVRNSSLFHNIATIAKIGLILALIYFGFSTSTPQNVSFLPSGFTTDTNQLFVFGTAFAASLVYVMYAYSGWNASTYIIDEVKNPERTLPKAMLAATLIVTLMYVALNAAFFYSTPIDVMKGKEHVARIAGQHIFGDLGGKIVAGLICFGIVSTISALVWIGSRVTMVMGQDMPILSIFSKTNKFGVPAIAMITQSVIVTGILCTQSFETIVNYIQFSITLSSFVTVLGVMILRFTQPDLPRPYRTWGYPVTPIIFLVVAGYMMGSMLYNENTRLVSLAGLATIFSGLIVYYIQQIFTKQKQSSELLRETS